MTPLLGNKPETTPRLRKACKTIKKVMNLEEIEEINELLDQTKAKLSKIQARINENSLWKDRMEADMKKIIEDMREVKRSFIG